MINVQKLYTYNGFISYFLKGYDFPKMSYEMTYTKESIKRGRDAKKEEGCKKGEEWEFLGKKNYQNVYSIEKYNKITSRINNYDNCTPCFMYTVEQL